MQRSSKFLVINAVRALVLAGAVLATACESKPAASTTAPAVAAPADSAPPAVAAAYICPMGCEGSASNASGKCPVCDMALERNPDYKAATQE